jgi:uncharacterized secreted protein with C-terminal beta-propeller domain
VFVGVRNEDGINIGILHLHLTLAVTILVTEPCVYIQYTREQSQQNAFVKFSGGIKCTLYMQTYNIYFGYHAQSSIENEQKQFSSHPGDCKALSNLLV